MIKLTRYSDNHKNKNWGITAGLSELFPSRQLLLYSISFTARPSELIPTPISVTVSLSELIPSEQLQLMGIGSCIYLSNSITWGNKESGFPEEDKVDVSEWARGVGLVLEEWSPIS